MPATVAPLWMHIAVPRRHVAYCKVFGHFFLDHLFQLYKVKRWLETAQGTTFSGLSVRGLRRLQRAAPFSQALYEAVFGAVRDTGWLRSRGFNVGSVMGSQEDTEPDPVYLSQSRFEFAFPAEVVANGRKLTPLNRTYALELRRALLGHFGAGEEALRGRALVLDRRAAPRALHGLQELAQLLKGEGYEVDVALPEALPVAAQARLVHRYPLVIAPCGSAHVQVAFMRDHSTFIELCESGFRYPNTAIYGHRYGVKTATLCRPLSDGLTHYRTRSSHAEALFAEGDSMPGVIRSTVDDVERERQWYSRLLSPECRACYQIHMTQDIDCRHHLQAIRGVLREPASNEGTQPPRAAL